MYVTTQQRRRRNGLGDWKDIFIKAPDQWGLPSWLTAVPSSTPCWLTPGSNRPECQPKSVQVASGAPPAVKEDTGFIPGSTVTDYLLNAATGKPTNAQIAYNANQCVAAIQRMRQMQGGQAIPPGAENQCLTDQEAYKKLIGGTAEDLLSNVLPSKSTIGVTAILVLLGIAGAAWVLARR